MDPNKTNKAGNERADDPKKQKGKKSWQPMKLSYVGEAKDIVRGGVGKTVITLADPGDSKKQMGGDP